MKNKTENIIIVTLIGLVWFSIALISWLKPAQEMSESERRYLSKFPELQVQSVISGEFMNDFEKYVQDQFPNRFQLRTIKAYIRFCLLSQMDNNNIYIEDGYAAKLEYPLQENSIKTAADKLRYLYEKYMKDKENKLYLCVVPDKSYYLATYNGYPSMDYDRLFELIQKNTEFAEYIDITDVLSIDDYYKTDIHWRQENLKDVAKKVRTALGITASLPLDFSKVDGEVPFYGVYYGQSALPMKPDYIYYLINDTIANCTVYNIETNKVGPVYDLEVENSK